MHDQHHGRRRHPPTDERTPGSTESSKESDRTLTRPRAMLPWQDGSPFADAAPGTPVTIPGTHARDAGHGLSLLRENLREKCVITSSRTNRPGVRVWQPDGGGHQSVPAHHHRGPQPPVNGETQCTNTACSTWTSHPNGLSSHPNRTRPPSLSPQPKRDQDGYMGPPPPGRPPPIRTPVRTCGGAA